MISCGLISEPLVGEAIGLPDPPILVPFGIIAYGVLANVFYTSAFGLRAFRVGLKFSIGLTILPAVLSWAIFLLSIASGRRIDHQQ
jgi:hypothetical protein